MSVNSGAPKRIGPFQLVLQLLRLCSFEIDKVSYELGRPWGPPIAACARLAMVASVLAMLSLGLPRVGEEIRNGLTYAFGFAERASGLAEESTDRARREPRTQYRDADEAGSSRTPWWKTQ